MEQKQISTAYFSMEFAFNPKIPNYAGGLGVLAADAMHSCADLELPVVGVSLIYHQDDNEKKAFKPNSFMQKMEQKVFVEIEDRQVALEIWKMEVKGKTGHIVPVYFLSSFLPENPRWDRDLTKHLYASDRYTRLGQEVLLGIGGFRALEALGHNIETFHMNEGHSAFLTLENLKKTSGDIPTAKTLATFTTHTPIAAGHDYFDYQIAEKILGKLLPANIKELASKDMMGMTQLGLSLSKKVNAVSQKHREVCEKMFPGNSFESITNGIYHERWVGEHIGNLLDEKIPAWREKPEILEKKAMELPEEDLIEARKKQKSALIHWINSNKDFFPFPEVSSNDLLDNQTLTIGFARRFVPYKRPSLIFKDLQKFRELGYQKIQLVFAGRCHPDDQFCNSMLDSIREYASQLRGQIKVAVISDYNLDIAKKLVTGCDIWLNNPTPPREASGTSGMKAALNGVLNLSILDGWWIEGYKMFPKSGWAFGKNEDLSSENRDDSDNQELLAQLEDAIHCFYNKKPKWNEKMKYAIALASYFNTHRMVKEYQNKMWKN
jgi:glycogen phosphorylase